MTRKVPHPKTYLGIGREGRFVVEPSK